MSPNLNLVPTPLMTVEAPITVLSQSFPLTNGQALQTQFAHGFGAPPSFIRLVLLCTANDNFTGIVAGEEIEGESIFDTETMCNAISDISDQTDIYLNTTPANSGNWNFAFGGATTTVGSLANFSVKVYYSR